MIVETDRLVVRELEGERDAPFILELVNDADWREHIADMGLTTREEARDYIQNRLVAMYAKFGHGLYRVELKASGVPIGICGLIKRDALDDVDLGFATLRQFRQSGYTFESAAAMMSHGATAHGMSRLVAVSKPANTPSHRLLEKLGFRFEREVQISKDGSTDKLFTIVLARAHGSVAGIVEECDTR